MNDSSAEASAPAPVALVTGGAGGLGRVITRTLLDDGFRVAMVDIDSAKLDDAVGALPEELRAGVLAVPADITDESSVQRAIAAVVDRWGRLDSVVNNAGIEPQHTIADLDMAIWDRTYAVNVRAPMMFVKHAVPVWTEQGSGSVVFIGSRAWVSGSSTSSYVSSKAAVVGLARSVASELGPIGVTANVVAPSFVRTPLNTEKGDAAYVDDYARRFIAITPLQRLIDPVDVANAVSFLASARARNITGEVLHVTAGTQLAPAVR